MAWDEICWLVSGMGFEGLVLDVICRLCFRCDVQAGFGKSMVGQVAVTIFKPGFG